MRKEMAGPLPSTPRRAVERPNNGSIQARRGTDRQAPGIRQKQRSRLDKKLPVSALINFVISVRYFYQIITPSPMFFHGQLLGWFTAFSGFPKRTK
jgi:hypothetical protein